jgi:hypothetical protein
MMQWTRWPKKTVAHSTLMVLNTATTVLLAEAADVATVVGVVAGAVAGAAAGAAGVYYYYHCAVASWTENNYSSDR